MSAEHSESIAVRALIVDNGKVLLGKRCREKGIGQYALIGGKPENGESMEQAVIRETKEETGLDISDVSIWKEEFDNLSDPGRVWHMYYFLCNKIGEINLKKDENSEAIYVGR